VNEHKIIVSELVLILDLSSSKNLEFNDEVLFGRVVAFLEGAVGYTFITMILTIAFFIALMVRIPFAVIHRQALSLGRTLFYDVIWKWGKVISVVFTDLIVFPLLMGWLVDLALLASINTTLRHRLAIFTEIPGNYCYVFHCFFSPFYVCVSSYSNQINKNNKTYFCFI
jgi:hypothetical protein